MNKNSNKRGFTQIVFLAIVIIATLAYFKIDLRTIINRPEVQKAWEFLLITWTTYIKPIAVYVWVHVGTLLGISN